MYVGYGWYHGYFLAVVDVSSPAAPVHIATLAIPARAAHLAKNGSMLYIADTAGGLQVIDVSNPFAPRTVGGAPVTGAWGVVMEGNEVFVTGSRGLHVFPLQCAVER